jgi:sodium-dependent dicarboxylate transporter 2/3/5
MRYLPRIAGPVLFLTSLVLNPQFGMSEPAWLVAGLAAWMAVWWLTAVVPLEATALLPLVVLPLVGTETLSNVAASYADPVIFLFLGGFLLAATLQRWELHRRFALATIRRVGVSAPRVLLAFMLTSAFASMWISNTATAVMMLPIALALVGERGAGSGERNTGSRERGAGSGMHRAGNGERITGSREQGAGSGAGDYGGLEAQRAYEQAGRATAGGDGTSGAAQDREGGKPGSRSFETALMLGIAYACSIGGVATLIGTPPNAILAGAARELLGIEVTFAGWLAIGLAIAIPMLALCWLWLVGLFRVGGKVPGLERALEQHEGESGRLGGGERFVLIVFGLTALAWIVRAPKTIGELRIPGLTDLLPGLSDPMIAIAAALVMFVIPLPRARYTTALDWASARKIPWGILLLFGGGIALAGAFQASGLSDWVGGRLAGMRGVALPLVVLATATIFVFLTELTSNTATAALGMPLMAGVAQGLGVAALPLMVAAALAASMAFMLPVATPPNAIMFGSGAIRSRDMATAGIGLNLAAIAIITLAVWLWT